MSVATVTGLYTVEVAPGTLALRPPPAGATALERGRRYAFVRAGLPGADDAVTVAVEDAQGAVHELTLDAASGAAPTYSNAAAAPGLVVSYHARSGAGGALLQVTREAHAAPSASAAEEPYAAACVVLAPPAALPAGTTVVLRTGTTLEPLSFTAPAPRLAAGHYVWCEVGLERRADPTAPWEPALERDAATAASDDAAFASIAAELTRDAPLALADVVL